MGFRTFSPLRFFTNESSIHGVRYIADIKIHKAIRILWTFIFILSILGLSFYVYGVYLKWKIAPDIGITANFKPIREIPFPSVTICRPMSVKNTHANFYEVYHHLFNKTDNLPLNLPFNKQKMISAIVQACDPSLSTLFVKFIDKSVSQDIVAYLNKGSFTTNETFHRCYINSDLKRNCNEMFNRIITDHGICYSYNMQGYKTIFNENVLDEDFDLFFRNGIRNVAKDHERNFDDENENREWTLGRGYISNDETIYPLRIVSENSVEFILQHSKHETDNYCPALRKSYKVIFHMPNEIPTRFHDYVYTSMGSQFLITMSAKHFKTDVSLMNYPAEIRRCFFDNERMLKFFKSYTKAHCDLECLTNFTLKACGCVKFSMPRTSDTPVCNLDDTKCYNDASRLWPHDDDDTNNLLVPCNCFPPCTNIKYKTLLIDHVGIDELMNFATFDSIKNKNLNVTFTSIKIHFKDFLIDEQISFITYALENFIAECGGLLGLFMGCSVLSIVELFYLCIKGFIIKIHQKRDLKREEKERKHFFNHNRIIYQQPHYVTKLKRRRLQRPLKI